MPTKHQVVARLVTDAQGQHAVPAIPVVMTVGDTVDYSSPDGSVRIEFDTSSPYLDAAGKDKMNVTAADSPIQLDKPGEFFCHCFITPPGKTEVGWGLNSPSSGGNHVVRRL
jgi:hypothetical protein